MTEREQRLEALAEAIVFAHDDATWPAASADAHALERTAALAASALAGAAPVPDMLQRRLAAVGLAFCAERRRERSPRVAGAVRHRWVPPFLLGLAAGAVLWFVLDTPRHPSVESRRAQLVAGGATRTVPWQPGPSPMRGQVEGDVVWDQGRQEGYLRFRGLPPLDPAHRFQLWIVDGRRPGAPVDGGLFAIDDARAETVVPIRSTLPVGEAKAFVVTVEARDGVVVSQQEHVVAIAGL